MLETNDFHRDVFPLLTISQKNSTRPSRFNHAGRSFCGNAHRELVRFFMTALSVWGDELQAALRPPHDGRRAGSARVAFEVGPDDLFPNPTHTASSLAWLCLPALLALTQKLEHSWPQDRKAFSEPLELACRFFQGLEQPLPRGAGGGFDRSRHRHDQPLLGVRSVRRFFKEQNFDYSHGVE